MIYSLLTLFAVYRLSSSSSPSRLLLQAIPPEYVPIVPVEPAAPQVPILPVEPAAPQVPVLPVEPAAPQTPEYIPVEPAVPQTPEYVPVEPVAPQTPSQVPAPPAQPAQPIIPQFVLPPVAPPKLECKFSPPNPQSCAGKIQTVHNPSHNFELLCDGYQGCAATTFNINFDPAAPQLMESMKGFWFVDEYAGAGAVININNQRPGDKMRIDEIVCDKVGSCLNTQFIIGPMMELDIGDFYCGDRACDGCVVKESIVDPGLPCSAYTEPI